MSWVSDYLTLMGNARLEREYQRSKNSEKYRYSELDKSSMTVGSSYLVILSSFGAAVQLGEPSFDELWFQVQQDSNGEKYYEKLMKLKEDMKYYYEKNKNDADILIDCPRIGQICAVKTRPSKDKNENNVQYHRGTFEKLYFCILIRYLFKQN